MNFISACPTREYLQGAREKCLQWVEKSRPFFGSHKTDEEYEAVLRRLENLEIESVTEMSEARDYSMEMIQP